MLANFITPGGMAMITNRSVPTNTMLAHLAHEDVDEAVKWLSKTFGFTEHYRYGEPGGPASGAQMFLGDAWMMVNRAREEWKSPAQLGGATQSLTVFLEDVDKHYQRAKAAGAKLLEELHETEYGELQYAAEDLAGHHWLFSRHARDANPEEWGATLAAGASRLVTSGKSGNGSAQKARPFLCHVEIPAKDVHESANFYEKLFGWNIRHRESARPSFDDAAGNVSGAWVTGRESARKPGLLPYIWVDDIRATVKKCAALGGELVEQPHPDEPGATSWIATFHDPAGNLIGLYQEDVK
jgi:predicted enzyme related to lactoylglutathione lyase